MGSYKASNNPIEKEEEVAGTMVVGVVVYRITCMICTLNCWKEAEQVSDNRTMIIDDEILHQSPVGFPFHQIKNKMMMIMKG